MGAAAMSYLSEEISLVRAALLRHEARLDNDFPCEPGECCPECKYGDDYISLCEKAARTRGWLVILLEKRGWLMDVAEIQRLRLDGAV